MPQTPEILYKSGFSVWELLVTRAREKSELTKAQVIDRKDIPINPNCTTAIRVPAYSQLNIFLVYPTPSTPICRTETSKAKISERCPISVIIAFYLDDGFHKNW